MCSRFELNTTAREIADLFALSAPPPMPNSSEIRPTDSALVITSEDQADILPWGLSVAWTSQPMINARAETLREKPTFRGLLQSRCLVIASAYFEWRTDEAGRKHKNRISLAKTPIFAMAGLINDGRFTIVTCSPSPDIAHIHSRMPAILDAAVAPAWIDEVPFDDIAGNLRPANGPFDVAEDTPPPAAQGDLFAS